MKKDPASKADNADPKPSMKYRASRMVTEKVGSTKTRMSKMVKKN